MPAMSATSSRIPARNLRKPISDLKSNAPKQHIVRPNERLVLRLQHYGRALYSAAAAVTGGMAEWLKAHAWKACIRATVSWVRIPLPPPDYGNIGSKTIQPNIGFALDSSTERLGTYGQFGLGTALVVGDTGWVGYGRADVKVGENINGIGFNVGLRYQW